ncbi:30S ribosome-binding factor RbfA [Nitrospinae bacterium AH_259_B05_G02_I21]|nr:30S ribosome-binding factor RbfA [Nitrospinae bacterium AH_259_B05_G02_I21]MDA2931732.1 30S ribosome-binding factor RbfA [Nitrospinae bacterium AH-259-F20]
MTSSDRMRRVNELLLEEIAQLLQRGIKDPRIGFVSVTRVETTRDLKNARVYVSVYGEETDQAEALQGLSSAAGYIRHQLFRRLSLKTIPTLSFVLDDSIAHGVYIASVLKQLEQDGDEPEVEPDEETDEGRE